MYRSRLRLRRRDGVINDLDRLGRDLCNGVPEIAIGNSVIVNDVRCARSLAVLDVMRGRRGDDR